ncbi:MAG: hypothetical protein KGJ77_10160 [Acidobacteriota bacterium]|nr:hypothetical protein [Acidobacteriota bacterium]
MSAPSRAAPAAARRVELEDARDFLLQSIEDLDAELAAGDIDQDRYEALRSDYTARAAAVLRALADDAAAPVPPPRAAESVPDGRAPGSGEAAHPGGRRRRRRVLLWAGVGALAAAAVVVVASELATRLPGQSASGSLSLASGDQLQRTDAQAAALEASGKDAEALALYRQVLRAAPTDEQALAEAGWLEFQAGVLGGKAGLVSEGQSEEQRAERADPSAAAPHLYLGSMLLAERRSAEAASELGRFLAAHPPTALAQQAWPVVVRAFTDAGQPVPSPPPGVHG